MSYASNVHDAWFKQWQTELRQETLWEFVVFLFCWRGESQLANFLSCCVTWPKILTWFWGFHVFLNRFYYMISFNFWFFPKKESSTVPLLFILRRFNRWFGWCEQKSPPLATPGVGTHLDEREGEGAGSDPSLVKTAIWTAISWAANWHNWHGNGVATPTAPQAAFESLLKRAVMGWDGECLRVESSWSSRDMSVLRLLVKPFEV